MISELVNLTKDYGIVGVIILFVLGLSYVYYQGYVGYIFKRKYSNEERTNNINNAAYLERRKNDLQKQEFFANMQFKIYVDIPSEDFSDDEGRKCLYRALMLTLFEAYNENMLEFVSKLNVNWDKSEWAAALNEQNYKLLEDFKAKAAQKEVPKLAVKIFVAWFTPYIQQIYFYVRKIAGMHNKNAIENTNTFLLLLELILMNALSDMRNFSTFDGELDGTDYKGKVIGGDG